MIQFITFIWELNLKKTLFVGKNIWKGVNKSIIFIKKSVLTLTLVFIKTFSGSTWTQTFLEHKKIYYVSIVHKILEPWILIFFNNPYFPAVSILIFFRRKYVQICRLVWWSNNLLVMYWWMFLQNLSSTVVSCISVLTSLHSWHHKSSLLF